eukprot:Nk52_evm40s1020 gene=Nk52_evmTU40s1020
MRSVKNRSSPQSQSVDAPLEAPTYKPPTDCPGSSINPPAAVYNPNPQFQMGMPQPPPYAVDPAMNTDPSMSMNESVPPPVYWDTCNGSTTGNRTSPSAPNLA